MSVKTTNLFTTLLIKIINKENCTTAKKSKIKTSSTIFFHANLFFKVKNNLFLYKSTNMLPPL
jgi:hypothetical protein